MVRHLPVGLNKALQLVLDNVSGLEAESGQLNECADRILAADLYSKVDSPSVNASLKDGYAVVSNDVALATKDQPVRLKNIGMITAGSDKVLSIDSGFTARVLTGAKIPQGADAILSEEYVKVQRDAIIAQNSAEPGRNIMKKGSDVCAGDRIAAKGQQLTPGIVGLLAAAGFNAVSIFRNPMVTLIATGDEVIAPGMPLTEGKLYASNLTALNAWCRRYGIKARLAFAKDISHDIKNALEQAAAVSDAVITSGGAWTGDRDIVVKVLDTIGWQRIFHRIRIGPGKAVGFGLLKSKPVFILPGGPPSNLMGFLQLALPGLLKLAGHVNPGLPTIPVRVASELNGRFADWTQFIFGTLAQEEGMAVFHADRNKSRLKSMACAQAIVSIAEGVTKIPQGQIVPAQMLI
ncbi:MAG: molybdopterin molybdotransferase MoeA [Desulfobacteraceae bacterium]|nr:molybdopterin molybdotransferase MoeA [Desulfobacteraceae bacterium]